MSNRAYQIVTSILAAAGLLVTVVLQIYMARPWGDNYAYEDLSGYLVLLVFMLWAAAPYLYMLRVSRKSDAVKPVIVARLLCAVVVCLGAIFILIDTAFIHIDAQGGLIFLFLPIYQWMLVGVFEVIALFVGRKVTD